LVRLLCHQAVLDSTAVSDSKLAGLQNTRNGWRMPASRDRLVARFSLRRILPAPRRSRQTSSAAARGVPIVCSESRLLNYRDPQGRMPFRRLPARPGGVRFRTPLSVAQAHWRLVH
jgi:hypothetical protein